MSKLPPSTGRRFGLEERRPLGLRLVRVPDSKPCPAQPFPFWLAVAIATAGLGLGAVGARYWLIPVLLPAEEIVEAPVQIHEAALQEEEVPAPARVLRLHPVHPTAPRVPRPVPMPAMQPEELVSAEWTNPIEEPWGPEDDLEEAGQPFPIAEESKESLPVAKSSRKAEPESSSPPRRPASPPRSRPAPAAQAEGESSPVRILRRYNPPYPSSARRAGTEGRVVLSVEVRSDGRVASVGVASSSGSAVLDSAAVSAVKRWTFAPEIKDGRKVGATVQVPFKFALE